MSANTTKESINTNGKSDKLNVAQQESYLSNKLVILGDVGVGKSSIAQRLNLYFIFN
jgi:GTPase SAR1 family protein